MEEAAPQGQFVYCMGGGGKGGGAVSLMRVVATSGTLGSISVVLPRRIGVYVYVYGRGSIRSLPRPRRVFRDAHVKIYLCARNHFSSFLHESVGAASRCVTPSGYVSPACRCSCLIGKYSKCRTSVEPVRTVRQRGGG